jgi:5-methylcytosine-specific restriction protein B
MAEYFTAEHFKLLNKWKDQKRDETNPEQNRAYEELQRAYSITESWANELQRRHFPLGRVEIRKRPTSQANKFNEYNWAKIYPSSEAPKELAYTVGIDAIDGFLTKIDTVGLPEDNTTRQAYLNLRGSKDNTSPIVAAMPATEGLAISLSELVDWSIKKINEFQLSYNAVVSQLGIGIAISDEDLLKHFDGKPEFKTFRASWTSEDKTIFCRLARAVHEVGLDWWHVGKSIQVRFGRKSQGSERALGVFGLIQGTRARTITLRGGVGTLPKSSRIPLTNDFVGQIEATLAAEQSALKQWLPLEAERRGYWPDELRDDPVEQDEEDEGNEPSSENVARSPINRIYYGPPGTGKTYELSKLLKREYEQAVGSVSREEWQAQFITEKFGSLKWWQAAAAAIHEIDGRVKVSAIANHPFIKAMTAANGANKNLHQTLWQSLNSHAVEESTTVKLRKRVPPSVFDKTEDSYWFLAGEWEEACEDLVDLVAKLRAGPENSGSVQRYSFVTFHQSYGYEEFVEGLRPVLESDDGSGDVKYVIQPGVFKEICRKARAAPDQRFAMVIDEINRGNISKIFGELITLIEADKREGSKNAVSVVLPYSGEAFSVPSNLDIIGTMNTADRSLALLDTALRRRFEFIAVMPDTRDEPGAPLYDLRVTSDGQVINIPHMLSAINQRIEALYDRDHSIGHAYFTSLWDAPDGEERIIALQQIFSNRVLPLLEEYFFEDWRKIRLVLADNQKPKEFQFLTEVQDQDADLARLFGSDHGLDAYATQRRYVMQLSAFAKPSAYIGIYDIPSA